MSRYAESTGLKREYVVRRTADGAIDREYVNRISPFVRAESTRSDITRTVPDATGWREPTPYAAVAKTSDEGYIHLYETNAPYGDTYETNGGINPNTGGPFLQVFDSERNLFWPTGTDVNRAVIRARNNVAGRLASWAESLAEARKTVEGIADTAKKIDNFLIHAARKDWRSAARAIGIKPASRKARRARDKVRESGETMASAWFYYWFGISPIVSDMVALMIALGDGKALRVTGKTVFTTTDTTLKGTYSGFVPFHGTFTQLAYDWDTVCKAGVHVRLDYECDIPALRKITEFGLADLPQTAWAVTPYSWLIDFVLPVSEVLRSLTATFGARWKGGSATRFVRVTKLPKNFRFVPGPFATVRIAEATASSVYNMRMERSVFTTEPNPIDLWVKDPLDAWKAVTSVALLIQQLSKHFSSK